MHKKITEFLLLNQNELVLKWKCFFKYYKRKNFFKYKNKLKEIVYGNVSFSILLRLEGSEI